MAMATTTPMMTAVPTPAGPGGGGGERQQINGNIIIVQQGHTLKMQEASLAKKPTHSAEIR